MCCCFFKFENAPLIVKSQMPSKMRVAIMLKSLSLAGRGKNQTGYLNFFVMMGAMHLAKSILTN